MKHTIALVLALLAMLLPGAFDASGQTWYYRRVKIVDEATGRHTAANDDAHYITFNLKSCYVSDRQGLATSYPYVMTYRGRDKGIDIYHGASLHGDDSYCYLDINTGGVNIRRGDKVHVYERVDPATCTAAARVTPDPAPAPVIITTPSSPSAPSAPAQRRYPSRRECPGCGGKGRLPDQITYATRYVANDPDVWCSKCGRWMPRHSHHEPLCRVCYGRGYVE